MRVGAFDGALVGALISAFMAEQGFCNIMTDLCGGGFSATDFVNEMVMDHSQFVITNAQFTGDCGAAGKIEFQGNTHYVEQEICGTALVLSSGSIVTAVDTSNTENSVSTSYPAEGGDPDLDALTASDDTTFDAAVIEFDVTSMAANDVLVTFKYVFASDEYNEFAPSQFNDVFAFFVDGVNVAKVLIIGTDDEFVDVSINTVNLGINAQYYINNDIMSGAFFNTEYDGLTHLLETIPFVLKPGVPTHIKLAIADRSDRIYDSTVYLQGSSFAEFIMCEYDFQSCDTSPCICADVPNCAVCNNNQCSQCDTNFFRLTNGNKCISCEGTFPNCAHCQDFVGCVECDAGYDLVPNEGCGGVYECKEQNNECPRYRRPWHLLSDQDRDLYIEGWLHLHENGEIPNILAEVHRFAVGPAHGGSGFFPWHRYYLYELETQIRNIGGKFACFGLPYWDWGHDTMAQFTTEIFSSGLSNGGPGCVTGPYFEHPDYYTSATDECLTRFSSPSAINLRTSMSLLQSMLNEPQYGGLNGFRRTFEAIHGSLHCIVNGDMCDVRRSSYDPVFYLHHCYMDFLWAVWQDCHDYDLVHKNDLDCKIDIYQEFDTFPTGLDVPLDFNTLGNNPWSVINDYNPTHRDMHDITEWNVIYDKGTFWEEASVENVNNCHDRMNDKWFIGSVRRRNTRRRMQETDGADGTCRYNLMPCDGICSCDELIPFSCNVCHEGQGCSQCNPDHDGGWFKKDAEHKCVNCKALFGDSCMFCQDIHGCGQCHQDYVRVWDEACKIWVCEEALGRDETPAPSVTPFAEQFEEILDTIMDQTGITVPERRELVKQAVCEISRDINIANGFVTECFVPNDFEDCSDMVIPPGQTDIDITLEELKNKPGVVDTPCLQEIRDIMFDWQKETGGLLQLCNGFFDPQC